MTSYYKNKKLKTFKSNFLLNLVFTFIIHITFSLQIKADDRDNLFTQLDASSLDSSKQTININNSNTFDTIARISRENFLYTNDFRYTLTGKTPKINTSIDALPLSLTLASWGGLFVIQHQLQLNTIWKEQTDFKFYEDGIYALYSDKAGHFFGTYFVAYLVQESLFISGFSWDLSAIIGTAIGLAYTSYVEILDGYGKNWGFSPSDFYADVIGAGFFIGQHYIPFLQNFTPKFMYFPARWFNANHRIPHDAFIDDYSSHTLWMTANIYNILPESLKQYWLPWLDLSFGYAARDLCSVGYDCGNINAKAYYDEFGSVIVYGNPKFIVALDVNLVKLLPDGPPIWNWFKQTLNFFKLPTPAIEFGDVTRFYLIYPFPINISPFRF